MIGRRTELCGVNFPKVKNHDPAATAKLRVAIRDRKPVLTDILNYRRDGSEFRNGVMITPLFGPDGELAWFLGSQVDLGPAPLEAFVQRRSGAAEKVAALTMRQRQVLQAMARGLPMSKPMEARRPSLPFLSSHPNKPWTPA